MRNVCSGREVSCSNKLLTSLMFFQRSGGVEIAWNIVATRRSAMTSKCAIVKVVGTGMTSWSNAVITNPLCRWLVWLGFAILFYTAGEAFTMWLLEPEHIHGGLQWLWIALFPVLLPAFFIVNRRFGCTSGSCAGANSRIPGSGFPGH